MSQPIAALHAFIRTAAGRSGFESGAPRVDRLVAHPDDADPGHDHQSLHSHHTPCAVIGSYKPCRHSIVEVNFTIIAADEPILVCGSLTITLILRHLIEKYTPWTSRISQSEERDGKFEFTVQPSHL